MNNKNVIYKYVIVCAYGENSGGKLVLDNGDTNIVFDTNKIRAMRKRNDLNKKRPIGAEYHYEILRYNADEDFYIENSVGGVHINPNFTIIY